MAQNPLLTSPFTPTKDSDFTDAPPKATPATTGVTPSNRDLVKRAQQLGVDPNLALSFFSQESSGNWNSASSSKGARGGMQVMPGTFQSMMGTSAGQDNPWLNMEAGLRYIAYGQKKLGTTDPELLAAGYHAGYDRKDLKAGKIPNTSDGSISTADYAKSVASRVRGTRFPNTSAGQTQQAIDDQFTDTPTGQNTYTDDDFADTPNFSESDNRSQLRAADPQYYSESPDQRKIRLQAEEEAKPYLQRLTSETGEGFGDMTRSLTTARWALGAGDAKELSEELAKNFQEQATKPKTKAQQEIDAAYQGVNDAKGWMDTATAGAKALGTSLINPKETSIEIARNAANSLPTIVGGVTGAGGGAVVGSLVPVYGTAAGAIAGGKTGMAIGTTTTELGAEVQDMLQKRLAETKQPPTAQNILAILQDDNFRSAALKQGAAKGLTIAAVDQLFMGLGGKIATSPAKTIAKRELAQQGMDMATRAASRKALASPAGQAAIAAAKPAIGAKIGTGAAAVAVDSIGEAVGEGASQKVARGNVDYGDALREGVASLGQSVAQTAAGSTIETAKAAGKLATQDNSKAGQFARALEQDVAATDLNKPRGPLERATEKAVATPERVTVTAPDGQVSGTVTAQSDTAVQIVGDDGQVYQFKTGTDGVQITPEAPNTPLSNALEVAANDNAVIEQEAPTAAKSNGNDLESRSFSELQDPNELINLYRGEGPGNNADGAWWSFDKADAEQYAKSSGGNVITRTMTANDIAKKTAQGQVSNRHRVFIEKADVGIIHPENKVEAIQELPLSEMSEPDLRARMKYIGDQAKANGGWDKMLMQQRRKIEKEINTRAKQQAIEVPSAAIESATPEIAAPVVQATPEAKTQNGVMEQNQEVATDAKPNQAALDRIAKGTVKFGTQEKADAFITKNGLTDTHTVEQTGKVRFEVKAKPAVQGSLGKTASWVIKDKATGEVVMETFDQKKVDALNTKKYEAVPILEHLQSLNAATKAEPEFGTEEYWRSKIKKDSNVNNDRTSGKPASAEALVEKSDAGQEQAAAVQPNAAQEVAGRKYNVVAINEKTGNKTILTKEPLPHAKAVNNMSRFSKHPARRIQLEEVAEVQPDQENGRDAKTTDATQHGTAAKQATAGAKGKAVKSTLASRRKKSSANTGEYGMTRSQAENLAERAFNIWRRDWGGEGFRSWKEMIASEEGADTLGEVVHNESQIYDRFMDLTKGIDNDDLTANNVFAALREGKLTEQAAEKKQTAQIDIQPTEEKTVGNIGEPKLYDPIPSEEQQALFDKASQRVTKSNADEVNAARYDVFMRFNTGALEAVDAKEVTAKLKQWSNFTGKAKNLHNMLNGGKDINTQWHGLLNISYLSQQNVDPAVLDSFVRKVEAPEKSWNTPDAESLRRYIIRAMLGINTKIEYNDLSIKVEGTLQPLGLYQNQGRSITIRSNSPHTVAHEIGHYLDYKWGREAYPDSTSMPATEMRLVAGTITKKSSALREQWMKRFSEFSFELSSNSAIGSAYLQEPKEVFARFIDRFLAWTAANSGVREFTENRYSDQFQERHFRAFVRLLQEKAYVDIADGNPNDDTHTYGQPKQEAKPALDAVKKELDKRDISHAISEKDGVITVSKIVVKDAERGYGKGQSAMRALTDYADQTNQRIVLSPSTDFGATSKARLVEFYKRSGFVENKGRNKDFTTMESMYRDPQGSAKQEDTQTIEVDGKQRSVVNSNGKPIAQTEEGLRNFWKWFGDSKVVDADGRPLVVYHGTSSDISEFKQGHIDAFDAGWLGKGSYFTSSKNTASDYAGFRLSGNAESNVMPVYLNITNPLNIVDITRITKTRMMVNALNIDFAGDEVNTAAEAKLLSDAAIDQGFDGVVYKYNHGDKDSEYVVFSPSQIKSATGNTGAFDTSNPDIRFSLPEELESVFEGLESRGLAKKRAMDAINSRPDAEDILYIENNFWSILAELEDSNLVDIKC